MNIDKKGNEVIENESEKKNLENNENKDDKI